MAAAVMVMVVVVLVLVLAVVVMSSRGGSRRLSRMPCTSLWAVTRLPRGSGPRCSLGWGSG